VAEYLQAMDLFVLPSLHEGLPVVLVEAQASGLYCLVSDKVAKEADLTERMTYLPIDSVDSWNHAIEQISSDMKMEDRQKRCEIFQERIRERGYDVTANADRMKQAYERFLSESSPE
jgi:glycosyltransferase involved in cell wall biosynthesis